MARKTTKARKPAKGNTGRQRGKTKTSRKGSTSTQAPPAPTTSGEKPDNISDIDYEFALIYLANMGNAADAYRRTHPKANDLTCRVEGHRILTKPNVAAFIERERIERWKRHKMDGDEAFGLLSLDARLDHRLIFDASGRMLRPDQWPDEIALCVRAIEYKPGGAVKVTFNSSQRARELIAQQTGKLKSPGVEAAKSLARILTGDFTDEEDARA